MAWTLHTDGFWSKQTANSIRLTASFINPINEIRSMKLPLLAINFKTYMQATGQNAVKLAKICAKEAAKSRKAVVVGVQAADVFRVSQAVRIPVYAQHVDCIEYGKNTGHTLPEAVRQNGAKGTFLNHAEHKLDHKVLKATIKACKKVGLTTIVFASDKRESAKIAAFNPDCIAVEPPELIGTESRFPQQSPR